MISPETVGCIVVISPTTGSPYAQDVPFKVIYFSLVSIVRMFGVFWLHIASIADLGNCQTPGSAYGGQLYYLAYYLGTLLLFAQCSVRI